MNLLLQLELQRFELFKRLLAIAANINRAAQGGPKCVGDARVGGIAVWARNGFIEIQRDVAAVHGGGGETEGF